MEVVEDKLCTTVDENIQLILRSVGNSADVLVRKLTLGETDVKAAIIYIEGIVDTEKIEVQIIKPLTNFGIKSCKF